MKPFDPHSVQNDGKLASDGYLGFAQPASLRSLTPQALSADHFATRLSSTLAAS